MFDLPKHKLTREEFGLRNRGSRELSICIEPWADRFSLGPHQSLDVVFVGPRHGKPEILPFTNEILIYGWEGSDYFALQNGRPAGLQPTVHEIIVQELQAASSQLERTNATFGEDHVTWIQRKLDNDVIISRASQNLACELAAILVIELASGFHRSGSATMFLWTIISRMLRLRGMFTQLPPPQVRDAVWGEHPPTLTQIIRRHRIPVLGPAPSGKNIASQPVFESESGSESS